MIRASIFILLIFLAFPAFAQKKDEKLVAVASTTQVADFTRQIVGDRWQVFSVLGEGDDPHTH